MGAGLKIDRPFSVPGWGLTWRMIAIAMPITIVATALAGWWVAGLATASALLLGAVLAPTDPVLAADVQVGAPSLGEDAAPDGEDDVRFVLTSEGGLNDALAFPFVYGAIAVAEHGWSPSGWALSWLAWDLVARVAIGVAVGWIVGRTLGIVAVFVAAVVLRGTERTHAFHADLHAVADQTENLLVVALLFLLGGAVVSGTLDALTWSGAAVAALVVLVVRPASGLVALLGTRLTRSERWVIAFFGIRGFGSVYYLAYALSAASFPGAEQLWATVALTLVVSIAVHGIGATPAMDLVDRTGRRPRPG